MKQAKTIFDKYFKEEVLKHDTKDTITSEILYKNVYVTRDEPVMRSEGADSRIHSLIFSDESERHVFGIEMASRGYGSKDKLENYFIPSQRAKDNYTKYILPILEAEGIKDEPSTQIVTQVW